MRRIFVSIMILICIFSLNAKSLSDFKNDEELNKYIEEQVNARVEEEKHKLQTTYEENKKNLEYLKENIDGLAYSKAVEILEDQLMKDLYNSIFDFLKNPIGRPEEDINLLRANIEGYYAPFNVSESRNKVRVRRYYEFYIPDTHYKLVAENGEFVEYYMW